MIEAGTKHAVGEADALTPDHLTQETSSERAKRLNINTKELLPNTIILPSGIVAHFDSAKTLHDFEQCQREVAMAEIRFKILAEGKTAPNDPYVSNITGKNIYSDVIM